MGWVSRRNFGGRRFLRRLGGGLGRRGFSGWLILRGFGCRRVFARQLILWRRVSGRRLGIFRFLYGGRFQRLLWCGQLLFFRGGSRNAKGQIEQFCSNRFRGFLRIFWFR